MAFIRCENLINSQGRCHTSLPVLASFANHGIQDPLCIHGSRIDTQADAAIECAFL